ncbi:hypothetical protein OPT61_g5129 [Boeremia exigua]|uniref:Uncharacterized protein n=1 Tax=Boeremia exigua TaxID=749465 RepID=A0ACC2IBK7_9PLEO|nr:hypothetical protein OPT61_g5129 [Boeremia exigua]
MCCGAGDWSDCTARWQAMGGRRIKRNAGHEKVAIPATASNCRVAAVRESRYGMVTSRLLHRTAQKQFGRTLFRSRMFLVAGLPLTGRWTIVQLRKLSIFPGFVKSTRSSQGLDQSPQSFLSDLTLQLTPSRRTVSNVDYAAKEPWCTKNSSGHRQRQLQHEKQALAHCRGPRGWPSVNMPGLEMVDVACSVKRIGSSCGNGGRLACHDCKGRPNGSAAGPVGPGTVDMTGRLRCTLTSTTPKPRSTQSKKVGLGAQWRDADSDGIDQRHRCAGLRLQPGTEHPIRPGRRPNKASGSVH